jgi:DNA-binding transcriptional MocR family regulator
VELDDFVRRIGDWDATGVGTLGQRLAHAIAGAVEAGLLPRGTRLPPERDLAAALHVGRPSVQAAIAELRDRGILAARQGSGTWVEGSGDPATAELAAAALGGRGLNLAAAVPADALQLGDVGLGIGELLGVVPAHGYAPLGLDALRAAVAAHYAAQGKVTAPEQIVVTNGGHGALADVLGAVVAPGQVVLTEQYTYPGVLDIVTQLGGAVVAVPSDGGGPDPAELAGLLRRRRPAAVVVSPAVNNPTGRSWSGARRAEVASVLASHEVVVVDDAVLADLAEPAVRTPRSTGEGPLAGGRELIVGSLSKCVWGGLRIGWVRHGADAVGERVIQRRQHLDLGPGVPSQLLAMGVVGRLASLLPARRALLASRRRYVAERLAGELPSWEVQPSDGGLSLWVRLPLKDAEAFVGVASAFGVEVFPGARCRPDAAPDPHIRIGVDRPTPQLDQGITLLQRAWATLRR